MNTTSVLELKKYEGIIRNEAGKFQVNSSFTYDDALQELTIKVLEILPRLDDMESPFGFVKKVLHDLRVDFSYSFMKQTDTSIYNKPSDDMSLDDMICESSNVYISQRKKQPESEAIYSDIVEQLLDWAENKHEEIYNLVSNIISPSEEIIERFETECVTKNNTMNRSQIPAQTIGKLLGLKKYAVTWYMQEIRDFMTSRGFNPTFA